ncbi:ABC transporter ATP-binding protein [Candidatus Kinetoplastidibacterium crithidiae]|uniref:Lipoprotein-releasing system ATP-binding protein n=1 Tax=Candidatus Kinetoplastidibacterium crithidiae TCC036E TaxID=1208918 RepID=M1LU11_9PROT|nr:ABC transporter ATP-binding protein [Candidatus Kinetoplastibacterium crithidii]AFZ82753.1 lipoprotein-releasing system ATP-binding protein [Candidatus Kinetoplastibacterium crithidii (ex Angomonas deanei ATCC 30255)]AGF47596.1 lipoprotein-releasing system ATP-binding protein [Candidatus Kinetoplastibacterium crithidii TCC036E]EPY41338.1 lipoprotein-releasing system ATP-binding protein [Angomonas deanei]|eukprot:EPY41338.1 lipoprotein-releasing system ATP-binding protein [Angomonas deanei]
MLDKKYIIKADNICKNFHDQNGPINILQNIDFYINASEIVVIMGASGSGKSTLLHILGLLDTASSGQLIINDLDTSILSENQKCNLRNKNLGFIYQSHNLLSELSVVDNVAMPLIVRRYRYDHARVEANLIINLIGLNSKQNSMIYNLSGGERQRVAIARSIITKPDCILADEPTGNLDKKNAYKVFDLFVKLKNELNSSFIIVTHDFELMSIADRKFIMKNGGLLRI